MGKALSTSHSRSSTKSPQLSDFCFLRLSNSALYSSCLLEGSKRSLRACLIDEYASVVLPGSRVRATCAFSVSRTRIQSDFSSSFHLFRAAMLSNWLIRSSKFSCHRISLVIQVDKLLSGALFLLGDRCSLALSS